MLSASVAASSQDFQTGYFLGGYDYAFRMNPALQNERGTFAAALGNIGLGVNSNQLGISTLLYPVDGAVVTAFNNKVPASTFLGKLSRHGNNLGAGAGLDILTVGFWKGSDYYTIDIRARADAKVSVPYALFDFLKNGTTENTTFDISGLGADLSGIVEAAVGWSRNFDDRFNIGARAKFLYGVASARMTMDRLNVTLAEDRWAFQGQGSMEASSPALSVRTDDEGNISFDDLSLAGEGLKKPGGMGLAFDLGASWNIFPWLTASASLLDIGGLRWNREIYGVTPESGYTWDPESREPIDITDDNSQVLDDEFDKIQRELEGMLRFRKQDSPGGVFSMLPLRAYAGVEARLPSYPRLTMGLLGSFTHRQKYTWAEGRVSINWNALDWLSFSGSTAFSHLGEAFGLAFSLHPGGVHLFMGTDFLPTKIVPLESLGMDKRDMDDLGIPESMRKHLGVPTGHLNANLYFGISLALGRRHLTHLRTKWTAEPEEPVLEAPEEPVLEVAEEPVSEDIQETL